MKVNIASADYLKLLFADFIQDKLDLPEEKVLIQNQREGQPSFKINDQIAFVDIQFEQSDTNKYKNRKETKTENGYIVITQTAIRTIVLNVTFYGPECDVLATTLLDVFYQNYTKEFLDKNGMHFIPSKTQITTPIHENFNGQWWDRSDLKLYMYTSTEISETVGTISSLNIITKFSDMEV